MEEISEKPNLKVTIFIVFLFIIGEIVAALISSSFIWPVVISFLVAMWAIYIIKKYKQIYVTNNSICIKNKHDYIEIPISNIMPNITRSIIMGGAYTIRFIEPTKFGNSIIFLPKRKWGLFINKEIKELLKRVNT